MVAVIYVFGISVVATMLFAAVNAIEPNRRYVPHRLCGCCGLSQPIRGLVIVHRLPDQQRRELAEF
jgi:hypothetical protein